MESEQHYNQDLTLIYRQISIETNDHFDEIEEDNFIISQIEKLFSEKYGLIDSKFIVENVTLFNNDFILLIKHCMNLSKPYKRIGKLFSAFCDYYNLPYNKTYNILHEKIQNLIKLDLVKMIGKSSYKRIEAKHVTQEESVNKIVSLFDMVK